MIRYQEHREPMRLMSPRIDAIRAKLREGEHAGAFLSGEDIAGLRTDLLTIRHGVAALEDEVAASRKVGRRPAALPVGTFFFQPVAQQ